MEATPANSKVLSTLVFTIFQEPCRNNYLKSRHEAHTLSFSARFRGNYAMQVCERRPWFSIPFVDTKNCCNACSAVKCEPDGTEDADTTNAST